MVQLIIKKSDLYQVDKEKYFSFRFGNKTYRDINQILSKNNKYILEIILRCCGLDCKGLNKQQIIDLIISSKCLILENI